MSVADENGTPNVPFTRDAFEKELKGFGRDFGAGANSRPAAFMRAVEAASRLSDVGPNDAKDLWTIFGKAAAAKRGLEYQAESSFDAQVSKFKQGLIMGALPGIDAIQVLHDGIDLIEAERKQEDNGIKGSMYDNLVAIAREQIANPTGALTSDQLRSVLVRASEEKTDLDRLCEQYKKMHKLASDLPAASAAKDFAVEAVSSIGEAIKSLDGDLPPVTKADKAKFNVMKKAKALGMTVHTSSIGEMTPMPALETLLRENEDGALEEVAA